MAENSPIAYNPDINTSSLMWVGLKNNFGSRPGRKALHYMYRTAEYLNNYSIAGTVFSRIAQFSVSNIKTDSYGESKEAGDKFLRDIKVRDKLARAFNNAMIYGLGAVVPMVRKKKYIQCSSCGMKYYLKDLAKNGIPQYNWSGGRINYDCRNKRCKNFKKSINFDLKEHSYPSKNRFNLEPWSPYYLTPNRNEITGDTQWIYTIPPTTAQKIKSGDHHTLCTTPNLYINAALNNNKVIINSDSIHIIEMQTGKIDGMPIPPLIRAFQELDLNEAYKEANRKIASDLLIPLRMLFPKANGPSMASPQSLQGHDAYNLGTVVSSQIGKWRKDKNFIPISPVEIGSKDFWGNGKLFALHNEIRQNNQDILAILGHPLEILYGGVTWSKQSTSALMLQQSMEMLTTQGQPIIDDLSIRYNDMINDQEDVYYRIEPPRLVDYLGELAYISKQVDENKLSNSALIEKLGYNSKTQQRIIRDEEQEELDRYERLGKYIGKQEGARAQALIPLQKEQRELARTESIKDSLAQAPLVEHQLHQNLNMQKQMLKQNIQGQEYLAKLQSKLQEQGIDYQVGINKDMMDQKNESDFVMMEKQLNLQNKAIPMQMVSQYEGEKAVQQMQEQDQMQQYVEMGKSALTEEEQKQLSQMPEEQAQQFLLEKGQQVEMEQYYESLPDEQKAEIEQLPEDQRMQAVQQLMQQEQQTDPNDPAVKKQQEMEIEKQTEQEAENENIQNLAERYQKVQGLEKEQFIAELMNEDAALYSKVKNYAEADLVETAVSSLMNTFDETARNKILDFYRMDYPEIYDEVLVHWQNEITKNYEADRFAKILFSSKEDGKKQQVIQLLNDNTPPEFKALVMTYYKNLKKNEVDNESMKELINRQDDRKARYQKSQANQMALEIKGYPEEKRNAMLEQLKQENPVLHKNIMEQLFAVTEE